MARPHRSSRSRKRTRPDERSDHRSRRARRAPGGLAVTGTLVRIGVDTGGTFTDFHVEAGTIRFIVKVPSTPRDPAAAIVEGLSRITAALRTARARARVGPGEAAPDRLPRGSTLVHGTTVGTNALLTRRLPRTALVTTAGFEDLIEIGRQNRDHLYDLLADRPPPIVPRELRIGVEERVALLWGETTSSARGTRPSRTPRRSAERLTERRPPRAADLRRLLRRLKGLRVEAIAIGFLHSYLDPRNEREVARALRSLKLPITVSHRISGEYREYERFSTAAANAALQPGMGRYLRSVAARVFPARLSILQSDATTASGAAAAEEPIRTVLSGPAGGALAAQTLARSLRDVRVLSLDMGGTSTDVVLIDHDLPRAGSGKVGGVLLRSPMIDVRTVGAGGGSLARRDAAGSMRVGPESAGADPGPACYGRSVLPTVTDAHIVLGRLGPRDLLGGGFPVDARRSAGALARLARELNLSVERTAEGVLSVVEATMESALRAVSMEQGVDPRNCALYAFGGAGGLHACALADRLGILRIVIPPGAGVFSATGLASARSGVECAATVLASRADEARLRELYARLEKEAAARLRRQGLKGPFLYHRLADLRYAGQSHEITIPLVRDLEGAFERAHRQRFGYAPEGATVEVVTLRVRSGQTLGASGQEPASTRGRASGMVRSLPALGPLEPLHWEPSPGAQAEARGASASAGMSKGRMAHALARGADTVLDRDGAARAEWTVIDGRRVRCPVLGRERLRAGESLSGPARITEYSSTTFIAPGWVVRKGPHHALVLTRAARVRAGRAGA